MRRVSLFILALGLVSTAALLARPDKSQTLTPVAEPKFVVSLEAKNPWTSLTPNTAAGQFQFAVVSDRTGGHRAGVFSKAVQQINLLQPEFVMSVGDLIEGQSTAKGNIAEWDEFDGYVKQFAMPFFYCPGNHDAASTVKEKVYRERFGRDYYHFLYQNCLFIVLNSNGIDGVDAKGKPKYVWHKISEEQQKWLAGVLADNANVRWTFLFLHHPVWTKNNPKATGWPECERLLSGRKYNVFCGHVHNFRVYPRNGTNYYQLATTGGGSANRGIEYGEFDQCAWVTMKDSGPVIAHILLNGVLTHDLSPIESEETGVFKEPAPGSLAEVYGRVTLDGQPMPVGMQIIFTEIVANPEPDPSKPGQFKPGYSGNARLDADGNYVVHATRGARGLKPGRYAVSFTPARTLIDSGAKPVNPVPEAFHSAARTPLQITVCAGQRNQHDFALRSN